MIESLLFYVANIEKVLKEFSTSVNTHKKLPTHKDNLFNYRFSRLLSSFEDIKVTAERLDRNIKKHEEASIIVQRYHWNDYSEAGQKPRREMDRYNRKNQTDLKALYLLSQIWE